MTEEGVADRTTTFRGKVGEGRPYRRSLKKPRSSSAASASPMPL